MEPEIRSLYRQLLDLHSQGLNGVWARIIKNAFAPLFIEPCHYIVGNPPWVNWENLPEAYRRSTMPLWEHYGLFPKRQKAMQTILGAAKYDISMLMTYVAIDRYLRRNGKLGFVISQTLLKSAGAGQGFRRFVLPDNTPIAPSLVEDMVQLKPFEGATNRTATIILNKGQSVKYPVEYQYYTRLARGRGSAIGFDTPYEEVITSKIAGFPWLAQPISTKDSTSAWISARSGALDALIRILGPSPYQAREGTNTGGSNAVFWVEVVGSRPGGNLIVSNITEGARKQVPSTQAAVEAELIYPLLRGANVERWKALTASSIIVTHISGMKLRAVPEAEMEGSFPKTFSYLKRFKDLLRKRPAFRRYFKDDAPFYSIFNIGNYTFSPWKVVWREQAFPFTAAVVGPIDGRVVIPDHKLMIVAVDLEEEAHYLCAVLNSMPVSAAVAAYAIEIQIDTHVLEHISVPRFNKKNSIHSHLAGLSRRAHSAVAQDDVDRLRGVEAEINDWVAKLWGLSEQHLSGIEVFLREVSL